MNILISAVAHLDNLYDAWRDVRASVRRSAWPHLLAELEHVDHAPLRVLNSIHQQLIGGTYRFSPKMAYAKRKSGGSRRGITVQGIPDRIVQRAILNIFFSADANVQQALGNAVEMLNSPTSFSGLPHRGVPEAIALAMSAIRSGKRAFAYSDMKDFFPCVPRHDVIESLASRIQDQVFLKLFSDALTTEIENPEEVRAWLHLFPISDVGIAQGSLLSTLVGNLSLRDFDARMNTDQIITVRYLDDFLVLAPDLPQAISAFEQAQQELGRLQMSCYAPNDGSHKAAWGYVRNGFQFLGCHVHPSGVSPARSAKNKLLNAIRKAITEGMRAIRPFVATDERRRAESAYIQTLAQIDRVVRGWGDAYQFVSNRVPFSQLDAQIDRHLGKFHAWYRRKTLQSSAQSRRRMMGVALLADTPHSPLDPP